MGIGTILAPQRTIPFDMWSNALLFLTLATAVLGEEIKRAVPQTIQLTSRMAPKRRSLKSRQLPPTTIPLADFFLGTDLQCVNPHFGTSPIDEYSVGGLETSLVSPFEASPMLQTHVKRNLVGTPPQPVSVSYPVRAHERGLTEKHQ